MGEDDTGVSRSSTLASRAYERLKREIMTARLLPEQRLHIAQLCERYEIGLSPMREALNRLSRDGMVTQLDRRGFRVAPVSIEYLEELTRTRCWIDEIGLRESVLHGDQQWEENIVLAYHRLARQRPAGPKPADRSSGWEEAHCAFHASLVAGCRSHRLRAFSSELFEAAERYRHLSRISTRSKHPRDEHKAIMEAAVSRNATLAVELLTAHFKHTAAAVHARLQAQQRVEET